MELKIKKIFFLYYKMSEPVKASLWFTFCSIMQKGIALLSTPIFTRLLTTEQFGIYSIYQSWYAIITIFATLNLYCGVYNIGLTKFSHDQNRFTSSIQGLSTTITILLFGIYILNVDFWNNLLGLSFLFVISMFVESLFAPAFSFWAAKQRYDYKYKRLILITLIVAFGSPILGVICVLNTTYKAEARVLSYVLVQVCVGLIFYIHNSRKGKIFYDTRYWKFALAFNIPLIPHYLSTTILQQADRIMIASMIGNDKAAIYSVAYSISSMMLIITNAINNSFVPYTYKSIKSHDYKKIRKNSNGLIVLVGIACVLAMSFGPEIIKVFATTDYYEAIWIIPPVSASVYFLFLYPLFGNIEFYFEETKFIMYASCGGAVLNIVLNYLMIPVLGYIAAGYTTLVCYIIFSLAHYIFHKKVIKKHIPDVEIYDIKFICIFSVVLLIAMIVMAISYNFILLRYGIIIIILITLLIKRKVILKIIKEVR